MKRKYMNRTLLVIVLVGYSALLFLLLVLDVQLLNRRVRNRREDVAEALSLAADTLQDHISAANQYLYSIYQEDTYFEKLSGALKDWDQYDNAYELKQLLELWRTMNEDWMGGYYIIYGQPGEPKFWYGTDADRISGEDSRELKEILLNGKSSAGSYFSFFARTSGGKDLWLIQYSAGNASVAVAIPMEGDAGSALADVAGIEETFFWSAGAADDQSEGLAESCDLTFLQESGETARNKKLGNRRLFARRVGSTDTWLLALADDSLLRTLTALEYVLLCVTAVSVAAVLLLYRILSRTMVRPMYALVGEMERIRDGQEEQIQELDMPFYELQLVNTVLGEMVEEIRAQRLLAYEEKLSRQEAELSFLQLQLNPHFYLNCLKTLNMMAVNAGQEDMQELILRISRYLRELLQSSRRTVALSEELSFTQNYVELQRLLSDRTIHYEVFSEEEAAGLEVPVLSVQTFVENSIKYAKMDPARKEISIRVTASLLRSEEGAILDLTVRDSGQGYPAELLSALNEREEGGSRSVGIRNLKQRVRLLCGEKAEFTFYNEDGAVSELLLPAGPRTGTGEDG